MRLRYGWAPLNERTMDFSRHHQSLRGESPVFRTRNDKIKIILRHLELILEHRGERSALHCITNRIALYGRTRGHIKPLKERVRLAKNADEIREALEAWLRADVAEELCFAPRA